MTKSKDKSFDTVSLGVGILRRNREIENENLWIRCNHGCGGICFRSCEVDCPRPLRCQADFASGGTGPLRWAADHGRVEAQAS